MRGKCSVQGSYARGEAFNEGAKIFIFPPVCHFKAVRQKRPSDYTNYARVVNSFSGQVDNDGLLPKHGSGGMPCDTTSLLRVLRLFWPLFSADAPVFKQGRK
jgi:hypothetical protein